MDTQNVDNRGIDYENTYIMTPNKPFIGNLTKVKEIIMDVFQSTLKDKNYDSKKCSDYCQSLSETICQRVKKLGFDRHKIVCVVNIGEKRGQGIRIASRCLWNQSYDDFVDGLFEGKDLYAVAVVFCTYQE